MGRTVPTFRQLITDTKVCAAKHRRQSSTIAVRERTSGKVLLKTVEDVSNESIADFIREYVNPGAKLHTDDFSSYQWVDSSWFAHHSVNHTRDLCARKRALQQRGKRLVALEARGYGHIP